MTASDKPCCHFAILYKVESFEFPSRRVRVDNEYLTGTKCLNISGFGKLLFTFTYFFFLQGLFGAAFLLRSLAAFGFTPSTRRSFRS